MNTNRLFIVISHPHNCEGLIIEENTLRTHYVNICTHTSLADLQIILGPFIPTIIDLSRYASIPEIDQLFNRAWFCTKHHTVFLLDDEHTIHETLNRTRSNKWRRQRQQVFSLLHYIVTNFDSLVLCNV